MSFIHCHWKVLTLASSRLLFTRLTYQIPLPISLPRSGKQNFLFQLQQRLWQMMELAEVWGTNCNSPLRVVKSERWMNKQNMCRYRHTHNETVFNLEKKIPIQAPTWMRLQNILKNKPDTKGQISFYVVKIPNQIHEIESRIVFTRD